ncbi:DUF6089 family protein [Lewinella sp. JB7]|uniref:type IX secretion system protein PorG n=1 Tax=Lewinella sp. JB7 TaxID=2962887 RepID=UPI0020C989CC|nr:DUF6089 family protein [Lewinella sp. JB7]MCP9236641.1 porin family protein [Lewinella sp. JB7]
MRLNTTVSLLLFFFLCTAPARAQLQMRGLELGAWAGSSFYLGDLNTEFRFNHPNLSGGVAARYNFNHRIAVRGSFNYGHVEAYDRESENTFERLRNLSFRSSIRDLTAQFEFNFLPYFHGSREYFFTPYAFAGVSVLHFTPTAVADGGQVVNLRPLMTEGQDYGSFSTAFAYGVGVRWDLTYELSMDAHLSMRNASTDYLDDVSTIYPDLGQLAESNGDLAARMSDRSRPPIEGGPRLDREGTQRGDDSVNDRYLFLGIGINYYFGDVLCPQIEKGKARRRSKKESKRRRKRR